MARWRLTSCKAFLPFLRSPSLVVTATRHVRWRAVGSTGCVAPGFERQPSGTRRLLSVGWSLPRWLVPVPVPHPRLRSGLEDASSPLSSRFLPTVHLPLRSGSAKSTLEYSLMNPWHIMQLYHGRCREGREGYCKQLIRPADWLSMCSECG